MGRTKRNKGHTTAPPPPTHTPQQSPPGRDLFFMVCLFFLHFSYWKYPLIFHTSEKRCIHKLCSKAFNNISILHQPETLHIQIMRNHHFNYILVFINSKEYLLSRKNAKLYVLIYFCSQLHTAQQYV